MPNTSPFEGLITKEELALRLKRSSRTVTRWMRQRRVPYLKIGHATLFNWDAVLSSLTREYGVDPAYAHHTEAAGRTAGAPSFSRSLTLPRLSPRPLPQELKTNNRKNKQS